MLVTTEGTSRLVVFSRRPLPEIIKYRNPDENFQQSGKQDFFRQTLTSSAHMN